MVFPEIKELIFQLWAEISIPQSRWVKYWIRTMAITILSKVSIPNGSNDNND